MQIANHRSEVRHGGQTGNVATVSVTVPEQGLLTFNDWSVPGSLKGDYYYYSPRNSSVNDCFADDAVEQAEETDTSLSSVFIGGRPLWNLQFADDIDLLASREEELQQLSGVAFHLAPHYGGLLVLV